MRTALLFAISLLSSGSALAESNVSVKVDGVIYQCIGQPNVTVVSTLCICTLDSSELPGYGGSAYGYHITLSQTLSTGTAVDRTVYTDPVSTTYWPADATHAGLANANCQAEIAQLSACQNH